MKKSIYITLVAAGVAFFASCKKEELIKPASPASSSFQLNKTDDGESVGVIEKEEDGVGTVTVGRDSRDRNGTGSGGSVTVGKDSRDRNGTGAGTGKSTTGLLDDGDGNGDGSNTGDDVVEK